LCIAVSACVGCVGTAATDPNGEPEPEAQPALAFPRGARPVRPPNLATPSCTTNPVVSYFGGPILQAPRVVAVFWSGSVNSTLQANIGQFYADVMQSPYWSMLQEYATVGLAPTSSEQTILPGTFYGAVTITPVKCAPGGRNCRLADSDVQAELVRQIGLGTLPAPGLDCTGNVDTVYMVDFPPNVSLSLGAARSCAAFGGFCGYHNTGTYGTNKLPLVYASLMDTFTGGCGNGCGGNATALENATSLASHELAEAVTDPDIGLDTGAVYQYPAGWGDNNNGCGEIADICDDFGVGDAITVSGRSWIVQEEWSNKNKKCMSAATAQPVCDGTSVSNCRKCSCGDDGAACTGGTAFCETSTANVLFGACEECTATGGCTSGTCQQSSTPSMDDLCIGCVPATSCPAGDDCGSVPDGCSGTVPCGPCTGGVCVANHCMAFDAGVPDAFVADAAAPPRPDAAAGTPDAAPGSPDAAVAPSPDAAPGTPDAAVAPSPDAAPGTPDAAASGVSDATAAGAPDASGGGNKHGGCGCHVGGSSPDRSPPLAVFAIVPLAAILRRRRRR
jgi:MYXO-CTERM domain-containing protein